MAEERRNRIVVAKDDVSAADVAHDRVASVRAAANIMDGVEFMAGEELPQEDDVLVNEDLGIVVTSLTDKEADAVLKKTGIEAVEDDEDVFAFADEPAAPFDGAFPADGESIGDIVTPDKEAAQELEDMQALLESQPAPTEEDLRAAAEFTAQSAHEPDDEIDFDDAGNLVALDATADPGVVAAADTMGIPRDKIAKLIKCILTCAMKELVGGASAEVNEELVTALLAKHGVSGDTAAVQAFRDYITCGLRIIYAPQAWRYSTGSGVRVAVVDTGIAPRHRDLRVHGGVSYVPRVRSWADDNGHGTHVAGTIAAPRNNVGVAGVAPQARLYAVKVLDRQGRGSTSAVLNGLTWCYRARMHVVNLSLGSLATTHSTGNYSRAYERAGRLLRQRGILPVAAAGNSGATRQPFVGNPARCPSFMAVAAVDCKRRRARFSSYGPQVEISAPGVGVVSTYPPNRYHPLSGTSMAAPHVAGVAALVKRRYPNMHGDRIRTHILRTATDLGVPGRDWLFGYGLVNAYRTVR